MRSRQTGAFFYEEDLVHHHVADAVATEADEYLSAAASAPIGELGAIESSKLIRIWDRLPRHRDLELPMDLGNRRTLDGETRRDVTLYDAREGQGVLGVIERNQQTPSLPDVTPVVITKDLILHGRPPILPLSHVIGTNALDGIPPSDIRSLFEGLEGLLEPTALVEIGGWITDSDRIPATQLMRPADVLASRAEPPFLHHVDEVTTALLGTPLSLVDLQVSPGGRTYLILDNYGHTGRRTLQPRSLRRQLDEVNERIKGLSSERDQMAMALRVEREALERVEGNLTAGEAQISQLRSALEKESKEVTRLLGEVEEKEALHQQLADTTRRLNESKRSRQGS